MSSEITIRVSGLSKCYNIYDKPHDRLKQALLTTPRQMLGLGSRQYYREFWALKDVSFEVFKGETVGIIGHNGSGKSTLLQLICGTLSPTGGTIETLGRVAALLELGSGFNMEFTGRENVYMQAAICGLTREEIDARYDEIVTFADIGDFIEQPVKTYSTGMFVRLAFAIQAQIEPDVLIVDEALAVGDVKFQAKCFERLRQLKENGCTILLVTHSSEQIVSHCDRAVLLNQGKVVEIGPPRPVINKYTNLSLGDTTEFLEESTDDASTQKKQDDDKTLLLSRHDDVFSTRPMYNPHEYRWGDNKATIIDFHLSTGNNFFPSIIPTGKNISIKISILFNEDIALPILGITIKTVSGVVVYGTNTEILNATQLGSFGAKGSVATVSADFPCHLASGNYFISIGVASNSFGKIVPHDRRYDAIHLVVQSNEKFFGLVNLRMRLSV